MFGDPHEAARGQASRHNTMAAPEDDDALIIAIRHVAQARRIVWQQRARIERLRALGVNATYAKETLRIFERNLKIFEDHRDSLAAAPRPFTLVSTAPASVPNPPRPRACDDWKLKKSERKPRPGDY